MSDIVSLNPKKTKTKPERFLTEDEAESLKAVCKTSEEQAVIRDMLDTGMRLDEALKRKKQYPKYL